MFKYQRIAAVGLIAGVVLASPGCGLVRRIQSAMSSAQSATSSQSAAANANTSQWTADKLTQAFAAIDAKVGAHPADYVSILITDDTVTVQAIDPNKRENVDEYTCRGADVQVAPVDVSHGELGQPGAIEQSKFRSDSVNPAVLVQVINSAVKDSGVENGALDGVSYFRVEANQNQPTISAIVRSPRATKTVDYDAQGHLLHVD